MGKGTPRLECQLERVSGSAFTCRLTEVLAVFLRGGVYHSSGLILAKSIIVHRDPKCRDATS